MCDRNYKKNRKFCRNLGIAFQIKDDILGVYADTKLSEWERKMFV